MLGKRDLATLLDIAGAARAALEFRAGMDLDAFVADRKTASSVQHQLMIIGEAVKRLSPECREGLPGIAWAPFARMRDRLIHGYDTVDMDIVWRTVEYDVPELLKRIEPLLPSQ